ncbi:hypothetical protein H6P81_019697 [Aristolochia fimbriata]|uniref:Germin-like protein n=1 Tax=Aristolochia fimbriata TaxID=158543 RepID=A0AAV7DVL5_ARIFI|nr:hypothetical protein H6P81_019697 [Aristolochia fimbriata]
MRMMMIKANCCSDKRFVIHGKRQVHDRKTLSSRVSVPFRRSIIKMAVFTLVLISFMAAASLCLAFDPSPLQDFCVADLNNFGRVNGHVCKDPKLAAAGDFFFGGLDVPRDTSNPMGSVVTLLNVTRIAGLNTLGISMARVDYAPYGLNPPHYHPRATEMLTLIEGTLYAGFITSNPENRLVSKVLHKGDVFVFPVGLVHFQFNIGQTSAVAISGLSSQNPGIVPIAKTAFGSKPPISDDILVKAFQIDKKIVDLIQSKF